jgi:hypothetical protein
MESMKKIIPVTITTATMVSEPPMISCARKVRP